MSINYSLLLLFLPLFFFSLSVSQTITPLQPSQPIISSVPPQSSVYFSISISEADKPLTITVTPISSGDPDLYASWTDHYPSYSSRDFYAVGFGADSITITELEGHDILYISVYGFHQCNFTIVGNFQGTIPLTIGVPQESQVSVEQVNYFSVQIDDNFDKNIEITVTPLTGVVSTYISTTANPNPHDSSTYQWSVRSYQSGSSKVIRSEEFPTARPLIFYIGVLGISTASFSITVSFSRTHVILQPEIPINHHLDGQQWKYYKVTTNRQCDLTIQVTALTGDPDIYASHTILFPSNIEGQYDIKSTSYGSDSVTFSDAFGNYYVGIYAFFNSSYTIVASLHCQDIHSILLINGKPQNGVLDRHNITYYRFPVTDQHIDISISVTPIHGDPDIIVSADYYPTQDNYTWISRSYGLDILTIHHTDTHWCTHCVYYIGVYAFTATQYTIVATTSHHSMQLIDGTPFTEDLINGEYEYFYIDVDRINFDLTISVTTFGRGDPDLFIGVGDDYMFPNRSNNIWMSAGWGADSISIPHDDVHFCLCRFYISVYAYSNTTFTILAKFAKEQVLTEGVSQKGNVKANAMVYYHFKTSIADDIPIHFALQSESGLTLLLASPYEYPKIYNTSTYQYYSQWWLSRQSIDISPYDPYRCSVAATPIHVCDYYLGVYGVSDSNYTIVATTGESITYLASGQPQVGFVTRGSYKYYAIKVENSFEDLGIILSSSSGDADLYVSSHNNHPNSTDYDYHSSYYGNDLVEITNVTPDTYYIGVYGFYNSSFSITALISSHNTTTPDPILLYDGASQDNMIFHGHWSYYMFVVPENTERMSIFVTQSFGDPDIFVSDDDFFPNMTHYNWISRSYGSDVIKINNPPPRTYFIGVYAYTTCSFSIIASTHEISTQLQDGMPLRDLLYNSEYAYYYINLDRLDRDLTITVTTFSGDPDLYVSLTNQFPNTTSYTWKRNSYRDDSLTIPQTYPDLTIGPVFIGVYASTACTYSIVASFSPIIMLQDGVPQQGDVRADAFKYYYLRVYEGHKDVSISAIPISGSPVVLVSTITRQPTLDPSTYQWWGAYYYSGENIVIRPTDPNYCFGTNCTYYIGIYGQSDCSYSLVASVGKAHRVLQNGISLRDYADADDYTYFTFEVHSYETDTELAILVTPLSGDPDLYISMDEPFPTRSNYTWKASLSGSDIVLINTPTNGLYYIGVYSFYKNSTFTIQAFFANPENENFTVLVDGVPQVGLVSGGNYRYYSMRLTPNILTLSVTVTTQFGLVNIFATNDSSIPSTSNYEWHYISGFDEHQIVINNPLATNDTFFFAVFGTVDSAFTINAWTYRSIITLIDGVPINGRILQNSFSYYKIMVDSILIGKDLTVSVTPYYGDPDLYISDTYQHPNFYNSTWYAISSIDDSITIPSHILHRGMYYISVFTWSYSCNFDIVAYFSNTLMLRDGVSQQDSVFHEASKYYIFDISGTSLEWINVNVIATTGRVYLYVSNFEKPNYVNSSTYQWSSSSFQTIQTINIPSSDPSFCHQNSCRYFLMVYGIYASNYSITISTPRAIRILQNGRPMVDSIEYQQYMYFAFDVPSLSNILAISLVALNGDPDLYLSRINNHPTIGNFTWRSNKLGSDNIYIDNTDPKYLPGRYFIGVYGYERDAVTSFSITASLVGGPSNTSNVLVDGVPHTGLCAHYEYNYYIFQYDNTSHSGDTQLVITVTPQYGDPDLFISTHTSTPTYADYDYSSRSIGADNIIITNLCHYCIYYIGVYGYERSSLYSIVASTTTRPTSLAEGVPFRGEVGLNNNIYFSYLTHQSENLEIQMDVNSGDPDLYILFPNTHSSFMPSPTHFDYSSTHHGSDRFYVENCQVGIYLIGIHGFTNASFTLTASNPERSYIYLINGEPRIDFVERENYRKYALQVNDVTHLADVTIIMAARDMGISEFYVTNDGSTPSQQHYHWASVDVLHTVVRNYITISHTNVLACFNCTYRIAVYGVTDANYALLATSEPGPLFLFDGQPINGMVQRGVYNFYRTMISEQYRDVNIILTSYSGDADLYVSSNINNKLPNQTHHDWQSVSSFSGGDNLIISHTDPKFHTGMWYISAYGYRSSSYSLVIYTDTILLSPGMTQVAETTDFGVFFFFSIGWQPVDILLELLPADRQYYNTEFDLYITTNRSVPHPGPPNEFQWHMKIGAHRPSLIPRTIHPTPPPFSIFHIGLYGPSDIKFYITQSSHNTIQPLFDNSLKDEIVEYQNINHYEFFVSGDSVTVIIESCIGDVNAYLTQDYYFPSQGHYKWAFEHREQTEKFTIRHDPTIKDTSFYMGIVGVKNTLNSYRIISELSGQEAPLPQPGSDGLIEVEIINDVSIKLTWNAAISPRGQTVTNQLQYRIYYDIETSDSSHVMYTVCGLQNIETYVDVPNTGFSILETVIDNLTPKTPYILNILVSEPDNICSNCTFPISNVYQFVRINEHHQPPPKNKVNVKLIAGIGVPVLLLGVGVIVFLLIRNRRLSQELDVEMNDVPKNAVLKAVRGPRQSEKYSQLLSEIDEGDEEYQPPSVL